MSKIYCSDRHEVHVIPSAFVKCGDGFIWGKDSWQSSHIYHVNKASLRHCCSFVLQDQGLLVASFEARLVSVSGAYVTLR